MRLDAAFVVVVAAVDVVAAPFELGTVTVLYSGQLTMPSLVT